MKLCFQEWVTGVGGWGRGKIDPHISVPLEFLKCTLFKSYQVDKLT